MIEKITHYVPQDIENLKRLLTVSNDKELDSMIRCIYMEKMKRTKQELYVLGNQISDLHAELNVELELEQMRRNRE